MKPTLTASGGSNVNVGAPYTLTLGAITDAGQTAPQYLVHWGDGTTSTYTASGKVTHTYGSALGPTTISVDVLDANGTHPSIATVKTSVNQATIALSGSSNTNPGATYTLNLGAVTDTGFTVSQYIVHWGDGTTSTYTTTGAKTHAFSNTGGSGVSDSITVDLVDNSGVSGASFNNLSVATLKLTVNPYPYVPVNGALNANATGTYYLTVGAATDPGLTVSQLVVNWGDGSAPTTLGPGDHAVTHVFAAISAPKHRCNHRRSDRQQRNLQVRRPSQPHPESRADRRALRQLDHQQRRELRAERRDGGRYCPNGVAIHDQLGRRQRRRRLPPRRATSITCSRRLGLMPSPWM